MVGDSATDIMTAARRHPGHRGRLRIYRNPVAELKPDRIIGHFDALPAAVAEFFPGSI